MNGGSQDPNPPRSTSVAASTIAQLTKGSRVKTNTSSQANPASLPKVPIRNRVRVTANTSTNAKPSEISSPLDNETFTTPSATPQTSLPEPAASTPIISVPAVVSLAKPPRVASRNRSASRTPRLSASPNPSLSGKLGSLSSTTSLNVSPLLLPVVNSAPSSPQRGSNRSKSHSSTSSIGISRKELLAEITPLTLNRVKLDHSVSSAKTSPMLDSTSLRGSPLLKASPFHLSKEKEKHTGSAQQNHSRLSSRSASPIFTHPPSVKSSPLLVASNAHHLSPEPSKKRPRTSKVLASPSSSSKPVSVSSTPLLKSQSPFLSPLPITDVDPKMKASKVKGSPMLNSSMVPLTLPRQRQPRKVLGKGETSDESIASSPAFIATEPTSSIVKRAKPATTDDSSSTSTASKSTTKQGAKDKASSEKTSKKTSASSIASNAAPDTTDAKPKAKSRGKKSEPTADETSTIIATSDGDTIEQKSTPVKRPRQPRQPRGSKVTSDVVETKPNVVVIPALPSLGITTTTTTTTSIIVSTTTESTTIEGQAPMSPPKRPRGRPPKPKVVVETSQKQKEREKERELTQRKTEDIVSRRVAEQQLMLDETKLIFSTDPDAYLNTSFSASNSFSSTSGLNTMLSNSRSNPNASSSFTYGTTNDTDSINDYSLHGMYIL